MADIDQQTSAATARPPLELTVGLPRATRWGAMLSEPVVGDVGAAVAAALLDRAHAGLQDASASPLHPMTELFTGLATLRKQLPAADWKAVVERCVAHPVCRTIHQEPFTYRTFAKPRGYAGDAVMIDYIYSKNCRATDADVVTPMGQTLFGFICETPACVGVRNRRDLMAVEIDALCEKIDRPRIFSVACGHLREAELAAAPAAGRVGHFAALDADELSVRSLAARAATLGITPVAGSIKALFRGPLSEEKFDFVYSTGLYDYLDQRLATRLTQRMFEMLRPGGKLMVANFLPDILCAGYMEAFMAWNLIYRGRDEMAALAETIPTEQISGRRIFVEEQDNIIFLEITKA